jgi:hypothetical protein
MKLASSGDGEAREAVDDLGKLLLEYFRLGGEEIGNAIASVIMRVPDLIKEGGKRTSFGRGLVTLRDLSPSTWLKNKVEGKNPWEEFKKSQRELYRIQKGQSGRDFMDTSDNRNRIEALHNSLDERLKAASERIKKQADDLKNEAANSMEAANALLAESIKAQKDTGKALQIQAQQLQNQRRR